MAKLLPWLLLSLCAWSTVQAQSASTVSSSASSTASTTTTAGVATSCLPSSMPSTALIVGPSGNSCAQYTSITDAIAALPSGTSTQYIYILAGTYNEQPSITRTGSVIMRGETSNSASSSANKVTIQNSNGRLSSAGGSSTTATFSANKYETQLMAFYNINFVNSYSPATNYVALAVYAKGQKVAFYGCNILSSQGTLYLDYGSIYFSGGRIEGTTDFVWGQGAGYIHNSVIVTDGTTTGQTIAAQKFQSSFGSSKFVFDLCAVVPASSALPKKSTYLGRDYSTGATVAYVNSYLDAHIASAGWLVNSPSSFTGSFVEANNTGPGSDTSSRSSNAQILSDSSAYTVKSVLGDDSWLDSAAIAPFSGWPDTVYISTTTSASSTTASATSASSTTATSSSSSVASTLTVAPTPTGTQYGTVASAIAALPSDGKEYTIYILAGTYEEQISLTRRGKVTLRGETTFANDFTGNKVLIKFSDGVSTSAGDDEDTPIINWKNTYSEGLALYNINFTNTYPQTSNYAALAADFYGSNMAAYGCSFEGFQDTLLVNQGVQVFSNCYIEGSVDFIWGYSKAYFHQCYIASNTAGACITAQNRPSSSWAGGFVIDKSLVTYTGSYGSNFGTTYLGRPWSANAIAVYMNSYLDKHIAAAGWNTWATSDPRTSNVLFGEFNNTGPGNWSTSRASFATKLSESQATSYSLASFIGSTSWLDMTAYNLDPSYEVTKTESATSTTTSGAEWEHPSSGTAPPEGAVLVSTDGSVDGSYTSLTDALASLPSDSTTQVIFMYPGTYNEQVPAINRAGPVMIIGYTESDPGKTYTTNQVIITQARGLSVSPLPTGHSNAETATIQTASTKIAMYNINIINSDNLDGSQSSYVTLAASIYGNKIGFYGCSFIGWQDTLLTGATAGYQYYESSYIDGAIDFIWGYSKAYFKGCTIGAKRKSSAITAHSRASSSAVGGYIFDQCLFTAADSATVDLTDSVYLGRPYSKYALVVVKNSYLDDVIHPAGWKIWSATDPRTDAITFAEYNNDGPGNWGNNTAAREGFGYATLLTSDSYSLQTVMDSTDWIDTTYWSDIKTPQPATTTTPVTTPSTYDGTTPPDGAYIVSKSAIEGKTVYSTIQSALDALPVSSKTTATVFIYPGTYNEQLVLSKAGTTIFIGYSAATKDYTQNQVTITYNKGIDTGADASNSDSATVYATGNYFQAVNINFANTYGTTSNYASLGFGVKSSKYAGLYGCQVYGNQDALLINGYLFASNSYIEGNIDMIWGSGAGYFLNSTIATNRDGISLTASKRTDSTTASGFVFDQCTVKAANGASYSSVSLGRPWNQYARVAYIQSNLGSLIEAAGWEAWTKADPRTDGVIFGEMGNTGAGASTSKRASFATQLSAANAAQFELTSFFSTTAWINSTLVYATPFVASAVPATTASTATTSTVTSSTTSTTSSSTSLTTSTTTVYTTSVSTLKQTSYTTVPGPVGLTAVKSTEIVDIATTITPNPITVTTTAKSSTTVYQGVTGSDETVIKTSTDLIDVGTTITPDAKTELTWQTVQVSTTQFATVFEKDSTLKSTVTQTTYVTSSPKPTTTTSVVSTTIYSTTTSTPKVVTVKSTSTQTVGTGGVTTTTAKATTSYITDYTTTTKVTKKTTTLSCIPAKSAKKRDIDQVPAPTLGSILAREMEIRAAGLQTVTIIVASTYTTFVKTSTVTLPGTTVTTEVFATKTTGKVSTLKASTSTVTVVAGTTKYITTIVPGSTTTTTVVTQKTTGKTTTLKATTVTLTSQTTSTKTVKSTITDPGETITSLATTTRSITSVLDQSTATVTQTKAQTSVETTTL
ncbi:pectin lyase fold/virulence factor, partial [Thelonectria olida]